MIGCNETLGASRNQPVCIQCTSSSGSQVSAITALALHLPSFSGSMIFPLLHLNVDGLDDLRIDESRNDTQVSCLTFFYCFPAFDDTMC